MSKYRVILEEEPEHKNKKLLKAKTYYFKEDWKEAALDFIKKNNERGFDVNKQDVVCYIYE